MAHSNIKLQYDLALTPAEYKLVMTGLELLAVTPDGRAPEAIVEQSRAASELATKLRAQREANAKNLVESMRGKP